jgi:hypothetical protein
MLKRMPQHLQTTEAADEWEEGVLAPASQLVRLLARTARGQLLQSVGCTQQWRQLKPIGNTQRLRTLAVAVPLPQVIEPSIKTYWTCRAPKDCREAVICTLPCTSSSQSHICTAIWGGIVTRRHVRSQQDTATDPSWQCRTQQRWGEGGVNLHISCW